MPRAQGRCQNRGAHRRWLPLLRTAKATLSPSRVLLAHNNGIRCCGTIRAHRSIQTEHVSPRRVVLPPLTLSGAARS